MADLEPITMRLSADILFFQILPRLPAKSVGRFKCVSKQWLSFIRTPSFVKLHRHHVIKEDLQKLLFLPNNRPWEFRTIDCETPKDGLTASRPLPFTVRSAQEISIVTYHYLLPNLSYLYKTTNRLCVAAVGRTREKTKDDLKIIEGIHISQKTNKKKFLLIAQIPGDPQGATGTMLVPPLGLSKLDNSFQYSDLILWNPLTGAYKTLSKAGSRVVCYENYGNELGLYYSSSEDDYKLVCVTYHPSNIHIYSLKSDSWRNVESTGWCSDSFSYDLVLPSLLLNEKLYFASNRYSIMMFDTKTEKLRDLEGPPLENPRTSCMGFMVVRGCIHFCVAIRNSVNGYHSIELWRMDGDGDWTKVETSSSPILEHLSYHDEPQHLMGNGNWLIYSRSEEKVYMLDTKNHTKDIICSVQIAFSPNGKYMETLVSPNQYSIK